MWLPPVASAESGYRNKAKMVIGGTADAPTIGILDEAGRGVDLRECGICAPGIRAALPVLAGSSRGSASSPTAFRSAAAS